MQDLIIIKTLGEMALLFEYLKDFEYVAIDCETTGLAKNSQIIGFSICAEPTVAFYVILSYWDVEQQKLVSLETEAQAKEVFQTLLSKKLIGHNIGFDCARINDIYRVDLMSSVHTDTLELAHVLDEERTKKLKELGHLIFGQGAKSEEEEMKASASRNGASLTKDLYELYKADADLIAKYGAKDALLTFNLFQHLVPQLFEQGLDAFFYDEESMPLLKGPTYELNTTGLKVDTERLQALRGDLEASILESRAFINGEIRDLVKSKYPGTNKGNHFNVNATQQLAWLLFERLGEDFVTLTDGGREMAKALGVKTTYTFKGRQEFRSIVKANKGQIWYTPKSTDPKTATGRTPKPKKVGDPWQYMSADADSLEIYADKYSWVKRFLEQKKNDKLLSTYVLGIQERTEYGIIRPSFLQHGTTSGRYGCRNPNFQNLPRDDKRIKACIVARPGKVFVGSDYSQLEPRVFASVSQDPRLLECFRNGEDFYSVVGAPIFGITDCSLFKDDPGSFATKHKGLRNIAKAFALATPYGTTAANQAQVLGKSKEECQEIIDKYFESYPQVEVMMLSQHEKAKTNGVVHSLYGRPRRIPQAMDIPKLYRNLPHAELPYEARNVLNLAMNHCVQSSAASIVNRAAIAFYQWAKSTGIDAKLVLNVHDQLVVECPEEISKVVAVELQRCMENTTTLPGVALIAKPFITKNLADQG